MEDSRVVTHAEGAELAARYGVPFYETSARVKINHEACFEDLVREVRKVCTPKPKKKKGGCVIL
jgi:hypothetical protein